MSDDNAVGAGSSFSHFDDIRSEVQEMVDRLYDLHDATDPRKGPEAEQDKHRNALRAVAIWWHVYGRLMQWAQSHLIGYEMARSDGRIAEILKDIKGGAIGENSHQYEQLGCLYNWNPGYIYSAGYRRSADHWSDQLETRLRGADLGLEDDVLRRVIVQLLRSLSDDSSVWRFPLCEALTALNHGEVTDFIKPSSTMGRGQPYILDRARADAVAHVYYLVGKGIKKRLALSQVGAEVGLSPETVRDWEKRLRKDEAFRFLWESAWIAGQIEDDPEIANSDVFDVIYHGTTSSIDMARSFLDGRGWHAKSLGDIRARLRNEQEAGCEEPA